MPFPPGVGGRGSGGEGISSVQSYDVITAEKAIDETNVGNRMLRNMGWQEGLVIFLNLFYALNLRSINKAFTVLSFYLLYTIRADEMGRSGVRVCVTGQIH